MDVLAYAVMGNHLHLVVRTDPDRGGTWTAAEVAQRWAVAHPHLKAKGDCAAWRIVCGHGLYVDMHSLDRVNMA